jgi:hypothetical protein
MTPKLTQKKQEALAAYLADPERDRIKAYQSAYNCDGLKSHTIKMRAYRLFKEPLMEEAVRQANAQAVEKTRYNAEWVLQRLALLAEFNISKFIKVDRDGRAVYDFSTATEDDWYCISEYTVEEISRGSRGDVYEVEKVRLRPHCKLKALELMGRHVQIDAFAKVQKANEDSAEALVDAMHTIAERLPV